MGEKANSDRLLEAGLLAGIDLARQMMDAPEDTRRAWQELLGRLHTLALRRKEVPNEELWPALEDALDHCEPARDALASLTSGLRLPSASASQSSTPAADQALRNVLVLYGKGSGKGT